MAALAERCDLSVNYITSIEAGKRDVSLSTAVAIAKALGVPLGHLIETEGQKSPEPEVLRLVLGLAPRAQLALARFLSLTGKHRS